MKHSSDLLLHFVGRADRNDPSAQIETCLSILRDGFRFTHALTDLGSSSIAARGIRSGGLAVCFTDIPLRLSEGHAARYGTCAIGVRKDLVKRWGGNPVFYVVERRGEFVTPEPHLRKDLRGIFGEYLVNASRIIIPGGELPKGHWTEALSAEQRKAMEAEIGFFLSYTKEVFDLGPDVDGEDDARRDRYYLEREWRVCLTQTHEKIADHPDGSKLVQRIAESFYLPFPTRRDVRVVVVPNERCKQVLSTRLVEAGWAAAELPSILTYGDSKDL